MKKLNGMFKGVFVILAVILTVAPTVVKAQAPPVVPVTDIKSFVECIDTIKRSNGTISDAVACVPKGCYFTVTMSPFSAQPAGCSSGPAPAPAPGPACASDACEMPRVIFNCMGSDGLQFEPSFTLNAYHPEFKNTELGKEVAPGGALEMGNAAFPRGVKFSEIKFAKVLSTTDNNLGCVGCHGAPPPPDDALETSVGTALLSNRFPPSPSFVIDTNNPAQSVVGYSSGSQNLTEVCSCIAGSEALQSDPNVDYQALNRLCQLLKAKTLGK